MTKGNRISNGIQAGLQTVIMVSQETPEKL